MAESLGLGLLRDLVKRMKREKKNKGLFKPNPLTPPELMRQMRDLLIYLDMSPTAGAATQRKQARGESPPKLLIFFGFVAFC